MSTGNQQTIREREAMDHHYAYRDYPGYRDAMAEYGDTRFAIWYCKTYPWGVDHIDDAYNEWEAHWLREHPRGDA
jgi:hypothetical protein